jgi:hypothetical protein
MLLGTEGVLNTDEKINSSGLSRQLVTSLASKVQPQQVPRTNDAISSDSANPNENPILGGRVFSPPVVSGVQWRPQAAATFQNQRKLYVPLLLILFLLYSPIALGHLIRFLNSNCSIQPTLSDGLEYFSLGLNYRLY